MRRSISVTAAGGEVDIEEGVVSLAVFLDFESEGLQSPILLLGDFALAFFDDALEFFHQSFDLGLGNVLARQERMLIERHTGWPFGSSCAARLNAAIYPSGAKPQSGPRKAHLVPNRRRHWGTVLEKRLSNRSAGSLMQLEPPFSLQPERVWPLIQDFRQAASGRPAPPCSVQIS